jgi:hypothetical protein
LIPDTVSRAESPASLQPRNELEKECCGEFAVWDSYRCRDRTTVSDNELLETFYLPLKNPLYAYPDPL